MLDWAGFGGLVASIYIIGGGMENKHIILRLLVLAGCLISIITYTEYFLIKEL